MRRDLRAAFQMLTRLPTHWLDGADAPPDLSRAVWAFPLVGIVVGGMGGAAFALLARLGMPPPVAATLSLAVQLGLTGALHEDGLADTADGLGGGATRAGKLEIMRDSRIGTYGALALMLSIVLRIAAIAALGHPGQAARALVSAACLGRGAAVLLTVLLGPARRDGIAASLRGWSRPAAAGLLLAGATPLLLLGAGAGTLALAAAAAATVCLAWLVRRQIGGFTGDVLGAGSVLAECAVLTVLARSM